MNISQNRDFEGNDEGLSVFSPRILIVDDAKENILILSGLLKKFGQINFALDGETAIKKAEQLPPDLILLDIEMPGMDGMEVLQRLREHDTLNTVPVVFITGRSEAGDEAAGLKLGAIDYITKPFNPTIVEARVKNQLLLRRYALDIEQTNQKLEILANTDSLTGAYNRRYFMAQLKSEFARCKRYNHAAAVMMLDIDHFKSVNDNYGHNIGDEALVAFTQSVKRALREQDTFGRIGGEEFALLVPETDLQGAEILADRILAAVRNIRIETEKGDLQFTVSIGVASLNQTATSGGAALTRADNALYKAKNEGRDRVVIDSVTEYTAS